MRVQESRENYLEAILMLQKKLGYVRSVDVALSLIHIYADVYAVHRLPRRAEGERRGGEKQQREQRRQTFFHKTSLPGSICRWEGWRFCGACPTSA